MSSADEEAVSVSAPVSGPMRPRKRGFFERIAGIGASAQAAIPGLYAWAITVAPAAWSRGAPFLAKAAAIMGVVALVTAPLVEGSGGATSDVPDHANKSLLERFNSWTGPMWARTWSVWGFVLSSAMVWALAPSALSSARLDAVRGSLGMVGWALFAFASAGPALKSDPNSPARIIASTSMKPRSELPRGDGIYVGVGVVLALLMQGIGWGVATPERAVLVRLVTVVCGIAVIGGTTSIALARHGTRVRASRKVKLRRAMPWLVMLTMVALAGVTITMFAR
jgi:hypothetical protein